MGAQETHKTFSIAATNLLHKSTQPYENPKTAQTTTMKIYHLPIRGNNRDQSYNFMTSISLLLLGEDILSQTKIIPLPSKSAHEKHFQWKLKVHILEI